MQGYIRVQGGEMGFGGRWRTITELVFKPREGFFGAFGGQREKSFLVLSSETCREDFPDEITQL